jgi:4-hydroxy-tetrahydrodipicolinate reductase
MIRVILCGANGAMGKNVAELLTDQPDMAISCGIDRHPDSSAKFLQAESFDAEGIEGDVIIDFSHYSVTENLVDFAVRRGIPAVICTTGLSPELITKIETASEKVALFRSGNMSLGINLLIDLAQRAAAVLGERFDVEVIEKHHNRKLDAPSGTALMIADAVNHSTGDGYHYQHGRVGKDAKRDRKEIGIHAVRGGTIVGEHQIIFAGTDEILEIHHAAASKKVFAEGAIKAARFISGTKPGMYSMKDVL